MHIARGQQFFQPAKLNINNVAHLRRLQPVKQDNLIQPVQKLRPEMLAHFFHNFAFHRIGGRAFFQRRQMMRAQI